jgi:hypothetical protein
MNIIVDLYPSIFKPVNIQSISIIDSRNLDAKLLALIYCLNVIRCCNNNGC